MAAILQLRQGSTSTYISQGPNIAEPFFDTGSNILVVGKSATEVIKLTKLDESNDGSFSITGDYTGSTLYLSGDLSASNANLSGDITIGGNIILGDEVQDNITVSGQFDSNLIPSASVTYDLGSQTKKWNHLYALSASIDSIDLTSNLPSGIVSSSNQIDTGSIHFQQGVELYSINGVTPLSGLYGSFTGLGVKIRGLSADGLSFDGPGNLIIDTGSDYFVSGAQEASLLGLPQGTVSGSEQVLGGTNIVSSSQQVIDFLPNGTISGSTQITDGSGILSSSQTDFTNFSQSIDAEVQTNFNYIGDLLAVSHSHDNLNRLNIINQNLSSGSVVEFFSLQTGQVAMTGDLDVAGTASFDSHVTIYGDLITFGTQSIVNSENLAIADNMIYLNSGSTITNPDLGWAGNYNDGTYAHAGIFRDASDGIFKFYDSYTPEPEGSIDTSHVSFTLAPIQALELSATLVSASDYHGDGSQLQFPGTNIVSSSQQVIDFLPIGTVSGSSQIISSLPTGTVSGSIQILGGSNIVSSSIQVTNFLPIGTISGSIQIIEILELQTPGLVSGSDQVTQSLDTRYLEIDGDNVLSSSNENFLDYSQSVDLRLLDTLSSGSETSQSLHTLVGNFPTSGSLGTSAFYNVSSSLADDPSVIPNVKAVYDYINNTIGAADITGVSASLGLSGGGDAGYVSMSLDTGSTHFQQGVELYSSTLPSGVISGSTQISNLGFDGYGSWQALDDHGGSQYVYGSSAVKFIQHPTKGDAIDVDLTTVYDAGFGYTIPVLQFSLDTGSAHFIGGIAAAGAPAGTVSGSSQVQSLLPSGVISGSLTVNNPGGVDVTLDINSETLVFTSGSANNDNGINVYVSNNMGTKQVSITGYNATTTTKGVASFNGDGFTVNSGEVSLVSGIISGSPQLTQDVSISEIIIKNSDGTLTGSNHYADSNNLAVGTNTPTNLGATQFTINDSNTAGTSGLISFTDSDVVKSYDYVTNNLGHYYRYVDTNTGVGIVLKPDSDSNKSWVIDTDGDLVSNAGNWASGNAYMNNLIASSSVTASYILVNEDITANNFIGNIQATNGIISGSSQLTSSFVDLTSIQSISGTKTFNNIIINGTGSFAYIESITGSAKIIGDAFIVLNNDTPTERYAGIAVYDSGSVGVTASLQFDGQTNDWFYEYSDDGGVTAEHGAVIFGPEYSVKGTPTYPTNNTIQKGNGGHHLLDSTITDDGTTITLGSDSIILGVGEFSSFTEITGSVSIQQGLNVEGNATFSNAQFDGSVLATTVSATGDIVAYASSDRRLKDEIVPIPFALDKINQIGGYSFVWNTEKQHIYKGKDYGVIAQEIEEVLPELVDTRENGYKAVKYDRLVSLLIEGIKELSQEVNELKEKLNRE